MSEDAAKKSLDVKGDIAQIAAQKALLTAERQGLSQHQQLLALRDLTRRFGTLHEAQTLQLRYWPFVADPGLDGSTASVDLEAKAVSFAWTRRRAPLLGKAYRFRVDRLVEEIRNTLLGAEWSVTIEVNGARIFPWKQVESARKQKRKRRTPTSKKRRKAGRRR